jgi:homoserine O-acetyltransferase
MTKPLIHSFESSFTTESGVEITDPVISYRSWGKLNTEKDNVVFICHALTGNTDADVWFGGLIGTDKTINPDKHFIICTNILGSCYGSTGPESINPETGKAWQADFPDITIRDIVRFNQKLLDELGITGIKLVVGGSLGGMTALEFALIDDRVFLPWEKHIPLGPLVLAKLSEWPFMQTRTGMADFIQKRIHLRKG